tara:strand:- start:5461 stop:6132 length:672 start_codon:yes stop_codon:yes gene_type:complete
MMTTTMTNSAASIAPPSPAASPRSSPSLFVAGRNLKVGNGTQSADDNSPSLPKWLLDAWDTKYNRYRIPLMTRTKFESFATSCLRELGSSAATDETIEAALEKGVQCETQKLTTRLAQVKRDFFLQEDLPDDVDNLLPRIHQESRHGYWQYIIDTLLMLSQLHSTLQPATTGSCSTPTLPPAPARPQPPKQRSTRIRKTSKQVQDATLRRSDRIRDLKRKGPR